MKFSRLTPLLLVFAIIFLSACSASTASPAAENAPPVESNRATVAEGILLPARFLDLAFNANGRVAEVLVEEGGPVQAGQVIARLEVPAPEARQAELARAELEIEAAKSEQFAAALELLNAEQALDNLKAAGDAAVAQLRYTIADLDVQIERVQEALDDEQDLTDPDELKVAQLRAQLELLQAQKAKAQTDLKDYNAENVSQAAFEAAQARLAAAQQRLSAVESRMASAEATLTAAEAALQPVELVAPWDGVLTSSRLKVGGWVTAGFSVASLADFSAWYIETDNLTEIGVVGIEPGQTVAVSFDALPGFTTTGTVQTIAIQYLEKRGDVTYTVRITLDAGDPALRWGMTAALRFDK
jgi:multidrug resistance efflux pump